MITLTKPMSLRILENFIGHFVTTKLWLAKEKDQFLAYVSGDDFHSLVATTTKKYGAPKPIRELRSVTYAWAHGDYTVWMIDDLEVPEQYRYSIGILVL